MQTMTEFPDGQLFRKYIVIGGKYTGGPPKPPVENTPVRSPRLVSRHIPTYLFSSGPAASTCFSRSGACHRVSVVTTSPTPAAKRAHAGPWDDLIFVVPYSLALPPIKLSFSFPRLILYFRPTIPCLHYPPPPSPHPPAKQVLVVFSRASNRLTWEYRCGRGVLEPLSSFSATTFPPSK